MPAESLRGMRMLGGDIASVEWVAHDGATSPNVPRDGARGHPCAFACPDPFRPVASPRCLAIPSLERLWPATPSSTGSVKAVRPPCTAPNTRPTAPVALKVLREKLRQDRTAVARFVREASFGTRVTHPNVIRTIQTGEEAASPSS